MEIDHQRLIYKGKQLSNDNTLFDYSVNLNDCIQLWVMKPAPVKDKDDVDECNKCDNVVEKLASDSVENVQVEAEKSKATSQVIEEKEASEFFKLNDLVDIRDVDDSESAGGYFEGEIVRITVEEGTEVVAGGDELTYYDGDDYKVKLEQLSPRARKILKSR